MGGSSSGRSICGRLEKLRCALQLQGEARQGMARQGMARHDKARLGMARHGKAWRSKAVSSGGSRSDLEYHIHIMEGHTEACFTFL